MDGFNYPNFRSSHQITLQALTHLPDANGVMGKYKLHRLLYLHFQVVDGFFPPNFDRERYGGVVDSPTEEADLVIWNND